MRMRRTAAVLLASSTLLAAACGSEAAREVAERSDDPVISSAAKAADEGTAAISIDVVAEGEPGAVTGEGVFELVDGEEGRLTITLPGPSGKELEAELRVVDGVAFMSEPTEPGDDDRKWLRMSEEDLLADSGGAPTEAMAAANPVKMVRLLDRATDFEEDGTAELDGEEMTRYKGTIDIAEVAEDEDKSTAAQLRKAGMAEIPGEVLVDDEGRLRRLTFILDLGKAAQAEGAPAGQLPVVTFVIELHDFGTEVDVKAPPRDRQVKRDGTSVSSPPTSKA